MSDRIAYCESCLSHVPEAALGGFVVVDVGSCVHPSHLSTAEMLRRIGVPPGCLRPRGPARSSGPRREVDAAAGYVVRPSGVWGETSRARSVEKLARVTAKSELRQTKWCDHYCIYAYKARGQRGSAREGQTFLVSYNYHPPAGIEKDPVFVRSGLGVYSEPAVFRGLDAWMIVLYDKEVDIARVLAEHRAVIMRTG